VLTKSPLGSVIRQDRPSLLPTTILVQQEYTP
jgi:hypothetical protein